MRERERKREREREGERLQTPDRRRNKWELTPAGMTAPENRCAFDKVEESKNKAPCAIWMRPRARECSTGSENELCNEEMKNI